ncbi:MAG: HlyC/CorC family transporter [Candidatus Abyssobacteria bacterium SURF_5]|uniref:HlyC/CorC family transporter n=1 Tax=Abyssobacteria bacterium (strain SURF_5) TaxID=2093360 RepID=A0A3A4NJ37_ABYX5|nr:MAG: HlyC/CorC family transporter [Candidatus Abyssubacteria bacterium SURF_5]
MDNNLLDHSILLAILLCLSFFFSGSETALFSLPRLVVERLKQSSSSGKHVANLLEEPNRLLVTILFGNLTVNILISAIIGAWVLRLFESLDYSVYLGSFAAIAITTATILFFGEVAPKTLAINNAERFAAKVAFPLSLASKILYFPLRFLLTLTDSALRLFGIQQRQRDEMMTEEELKTLVAMGVEEGVLKSTERLMIHRIFEFGDTLVRDVFVPRTEMIRVKFDITVEELSRIMRETGHSRFPVYGKTVDDIRGIVYAKDLFPYFWRGQLNIPISLFIRSAYYVPETKKVRDLLREFQSGHIHMAIVVDEHGGTSGIVTLEDLIEEVVGEIFDEYDIRKKQFEHLPNGILRVDARLRLDELSDLLETDIHAAEVDTVGGLIYELLERVPTPGEFVEHEGYRFAVEDMKNRRIRTVLVSPLPGDGNVNRKILS